MRNRILVLVAAVCMTMGVAAQEQMDTVAVVFDQEAVKKEAEENYEKGNKYWKAKEIDKALTYYVLSADAGHAEAQYLLGLLCIEGKKVVQDTEKGIEWLTKAGLQGHKDAQFNLASIYLQGKLVPKDLEKAQFWAAKYKNLDTAPAEK